jgi:hypothetical protein
MLRRLATAVGSFLLLAGPVLAQQPAPPAQPGADSMNDFVPRSSLPPSEQIPGGRLVVAAYGFFLVLVVFYVWTIWRRIGKVEQDMQALERRQAGAKR